jgi:hypothetical protein
MNSLSHNKHVGMWSFDILVILGLIAMIVFVKTMLFKSPHANQPDAAQIDSSSAPKVFRQWKEAKGFFPAHGIRILHLSDITLDIKTLYQGNWDEQDRQLIDDIFQQPALWHHEVKSDIIDNMAALGVIVTDNSADPADAIASGNVTGLLLAKKFIFKSGSIQAQLYLEVRSQHNGDLIAIFKIEEKQHI